MMEVGADLGEKAFIPCMGREF